MNSNFFSKNSKSPRRRAGLILGALALLPLGPQASAPGSTAQAQALPSTAVRGLWVDAFGPGLKTPEQVSQLVTDAEAAGINTLVVQVVRRMDCLCLRSSVPPVSDTDIPRGFDPLADVTAKAQARGMRVIAWVIATAAHSDAHPNRDPRHVMQSNGPGSRADWFSRRSDGLVKLERDTYLDPGHPGVQDYVTNMAVSIVRNYPVDGIQLDRIRYPDGNLGNNVPSWGYNAVALARFAAETGVQGRPAPTNPTWMNWRREQINHLVRRVSAEVKAVRPNVWVSAATITYGAAPGNLQDFARSRTYLEVLQDWPSWVNSGHVDMNMLMNYKREDGPGQAASYDGWIRFARNHAPGALTISGASIYLNTPQASAAQFQRAIAAGAGWVGYSYRTPTLATYQSGADPAQEWATLRALLPQSAPAFTARAPQLRRLSGRVVGHARSGWHEVRLVQGGQVIATARTDANGRYFFSAVPAGRFEVQVGNQRWRSEGRPGAVLRLPDLLLRDVPLRPLPRDIGDFPADDVQ